MTRFVSGPVRVSVPATSANLGPGFDTLGLALDLRDEVVAEVLPDADPGSPPQITVRGEGAGSVALDEGHLVHAAMRAGFASLGVELPVVRLACTNVVPHARGLGSSSAAIVAGICASRSLVAGGAELLDDPAALALAAEMEGHPDNVAPALLGGFTIAYAGRGGARAVRLDVDPRVEVVALVPPTGVRTELARGLLPAEVTHRDAAANAGRSALLVAALTGHPELLLDATEDRLHQDYRRPAMPESLALLGALREDGLPAVISGAGPTVLVLAGPDGRTDLRSDLGRRLPAGWRLVDCAIARDGAGVQLPPSRGQH